MVVPPAQFLYFRYEISGNSGKTACDLAVLPIAAPPAAEDFRGERDVVR